MRVGRRGFTTARRCLVFGVDEAGRGPLIGPMVLAVVALDPESEASLAQAGVVDSKAFGAGPVARARRAELAEQIVELAPRTAVRQVEVDEVDAHTCRGQLNVLERRVACELLRELGAHDERIVCDGATLFSPLRSVFSGLEALDRGESVHRSVAAASILAKHRRDEAFAAIARRYEPEFGPINGGGYVNAATRRFVDAYIDRYGTLPPEVRRSWGASKLEADPLSPS